MSKRLTGTLVLTLTLALAAAAPGGVVFTGDGSPADVGYRYEGVDVFDLDTPSGILHQRHDEGAWGRWDARAEYDEFVGTELIRANGWFVEFRLEVISNNALSISQGGGLYVGDDVGRTAVYLHPDRYVAGIGSVLEVPITPGYHTLRLEMAPGGTAFDMFVDGVSSGAVVPSPNGGAGDHRFYFGDSSGPPAAEINYDYVVVNQEIPEPATLWMLGLAGTLIVGARRRR